VQKDIAAAVPSADEGVPMFHIRLRVAAAVVAALAIGRAQPARAAGPLDPPEPYRTRGTVELTIEGPGCCGDVPVTGRFEADYALEPGGGVTLRRLGLSLDDANLVVRDGFLGLFSERILLRCGQFGLRDLARGSVAGADVLKFPAGAVKLSGRAARSREADGLCSAPTLSMTGENSAEVLLTHRPGADEIALAATLALEADGATYTMRIAGEGRFVNRPPQAALAFRYPDGTYPQGGCPAFWHWNGQQHELLAEANGPSGLRGSLMSYASDPDGTWAAADVLNDLWFDTRGNGPLTRLGSGRDVGPLVFDWGAPHRIELLALDHAGAADAASCSFRVADTRPPGVQAPAALVTGCSTPGGATGATSPALSAFLSAASAVDVVDVSPTALAPQVGGIDVTPTTPFPATGVARVVRFRFRDDTGNVGVADANVTVKDVIAPVVTVGAVPSIVPPNPASFFAITASPAATDACGVTTYRLKSITSNAPAFDATDVVGAVVGTDDRAFQLRGRPAGPGVDRLYRIVYEARDAAGNVGTADAFVRVRAS
jgi:hypothetical protein